MTTLIERFTSNETAPLVGETTTTELQVEALNELLRGELTAIQTYEQCIGGIEDPDLAVELRKLQQSHVVRRDQIANRIRLLGGEPDESAGLWGAFARLVEAGATLFGDTIALKTLEEGELLGVRQYYQDLPDLDRANLHFVATHLRPEQDRTCTAVADLIHERETQSA